MGNTSDQKLHLRIVQKIGEESGENLVESLKIMCLQEYKAYPIRARVNEDVKSSQTLICVQGAHVAGTDEHKGESKQHGMLTEASFEAIVKTVCEMDVGADAPSKETMQLWLTAEQAQWCGRWTG